MRRRGFLAGLGALAVVPLPARGAAAAGLVGKPLPELVVTRADGASATLQEWQGKALLLHLWATWCQPCIVELPKLDRLHARLADRPGAEVLTVCIDEGPVRPLVDRLMRQKGYRLPVVYEASGAAAASFGADVLPMTWLVDAGGVVRAELRGAREWDSEQWVSALAALEAAP